MASFTTDLMKSSSVPPAKKALIIIDVQDDSLDDDNGVHLAKNPDFIPRLKDLIPIIRPGMRIFWTYKFIQKGGLHEVSAKKAYIHHEILDVFDGENDPIVEQNYDSAFEETALLMALRKEIISEVYLCGRWTNTALLSTARDAIQYGIRLHLIEDCLGYREEDQHLEAIEQMIDQIGLEVVTSEEVKGLYLKHEGTDVGQCFEKLYLNTDQD